MASKQRVVGFNKDSAAKVSKDEWVKAREKQFPDFDLGSEYDKLVPNQPQVKKPKQSDKE